MGREGELEKQLRILWYREGEDRDNYARENNMLWAIGLDDESIIEHIVADAGKKFPVVVYNPKERILYDSPLGFSNYQIQLIHSWFIECFGEKAK